MQVKKSFTSCSATKYARKQKDTITRLEVRSTGCTLDKLCSDCLGDVSVAVSSMLVLVNWH